VLINPSCRTGAETSDAPFQSASVSLNCCESSLSTSEPAAIDAARAAYLNTWATLSAFGRPYEIWISITRRLAQCRYLKETRPSGGPWGAVFLNRFDQRIALRARLTLHTIKSPSTPEYGELCIVQHELNELFAAR